MVGLTHSWTSRTSTGWKLWLWWVLANTVGSAVGAALAFGSMNAVKAFVPGAGANEDRVFGVMLLATLVVAIGLAQWAVMRRHVPQAWQWPFASALGVCVGFALVISAGTLLGARAVLPYGLGMLSGMAGMALFGLGVGAVQWLYLRQHVAHSGWWILASAFGWAVLGIVVDKAFTVPIQVAFVGLVPALFTGAALVWLVRQDKSHRMANWL